MGTPKLRWRDVIRKDKIEELQDRRTWRLKTRYADPTYGTKDNGCLLGCSISPILEREMLFPQQVAVGRNMVTVN